MNTQYFPGTTVIVIDVMAKPIGEGVVEKYFFSERSYRVRWTYEQTGKSEFVTVPEWRLLKKNK
jgi:hypothetical protein